jgi:hypothetical protein
MFSVEKVKLARFEKVEVIALGVIAPTALLLYTILLLVSGEAVFWGRGSNVIYHGNEAYFVSLLWFGSSICLLTHFLFRPLKMFNYRTRKHLIYISAVLVCIGLTSAVVLV